MEMVRRSVTSAREPRTRSLCCMFGACRRLCHPVDVSTKLLSLILQGNVASGRYRAIVLVGHGHRFTAYRCVVGSQALVFGAGEKTTGLVGIHGPVVGPEFGKDRIEP